MVTEILIHRARSILIFHTTQEAIEHLVSEGVEEENAYLAVKAANLLITFQDED